MKLIKQGGNKRLNEFISSYEINKAQVKPEILYGSVLLEYYRQLIRCEIYKGETQLQKPSKYDALKLYASVNGDIKDIDPTINGEKRYGFVESEANKDIVDNSIFGTVNGWFSSALDTGKTLANTIKDKANETSIGSKIIETGSYSVDLLKGTGKVIIDTGSEVGSQVAVSFKYL